MSYFIAENSRVSSVRVIYLLLWNSTALLQPEKQGKVPSCPRQVQETKLSEKAETDPNKVLTERERVQFCVYCAGTVCLLRAFVVFKLHSCVGILMECSSFVNMRLESVTTAELKTIWSNIVLDWDSLCRRTCHVFTAPNSSTFRGIDRCCDHDN